MINNDRRSESQLFETFADRAVRFGSEFYFSKAPAIEFIEACDENDFAVIGIEGFRINETMIQPDMGLIADYSEHLRDGNWPEMRRLNNAAARRFLEDVDSDVFLNFVIIDSFKAARR
jgi:hypothetical protein